MERETSLQGDHMIPLMPRERPGPEVIHGDETPVPTDGPLTDGFGRLIKNLRVSVTDRCNFRCTYCMPEEGLEWLGRDDILSYEEIERLVGVFARIGVEEVRLTGGEPLVRRDLPLLIEKLARIELKSLSLTTNGFALKEHCAALVAAGLRRINVSMDTPVREKFAHITRRDALPQVLAGLEECERYPSLRPIKVNAVAIRGFSEDDVLAFAELARRKPYTVRWIEFMPLDADGHWDRDDVLTGDEIRAIIQSRYPLVPVADDGRVQTARRFAFADGAGEVGFINPVSEPFCESCDRIRLTADGQFRTCLFSTWETDLRAPLRSGAGDAELEQVIRAAVWRKEMKHHINDAGFQRASRSMSQIGG